MLSERAQQALAFRRGTVVSTATRAPTDPALIEATVDSWLRRDEPEPGAGY